MPAENNDQCIAGDRIVAEKFKKCSQEEDSDEIWEKIKRYGEIQ